VERSVYTVLRSPHVDKKSREQFEMRVHKRMIEILDTSQRTVEALMKLDLPAGVDVSIKLHRTHANRFSFYATSKTRLLRRFHDLIHKLVH